MIPRTLDNRHKVSLDIPVQVNEDGTVAHLCPLCSCQFWNIQASFSDFEMAMYFTEMECANCGYATRAPTPSDNPWRSLV